MSDPYNYRGKDSLNLVRLPVVKRAPLPVPQWKPWERLRKIARAAGYNPSIKVDAVQVASSTLEKAQHGRIKSLFVSIQWDDDSYSTDFSAMRNSELLAHAFYVTRQAHAKINKSMEGM